MTSHEWYDPIKVNDPETRSYATRHPLDPNQSDRGTRTAALPWTGFVIFICMSGCVAPRISVDGLSLAPVVASPSPGAEASRQEPVAGKAQTPPPSTPAGLPNTDNAPATPRPALTPVATPQPTPAPAVRVVLSRYAGVLDAPDLEGRPDPGFVNRLSLTADVIHADGTSNRNILWETSDPGLAVWTNNEVVASAGAPDGIVVLTARSIRTPTIFATASFTIRANGAAEVVIR